MTKRRSSLERSRITEQMEKHQADLCETAERAAEHVADSETERATLERLEGGTAEGGDEVQLHIEAAQETSAGEFERLGDNLEQVHHETEEHERELHEGAERGEADGEAIADAASQVRGEGASRELTEAQEAARRDVELLTSMEQRIREAREQSQRLYEEYRRRVNSARGR